MEKQKELKTQVENVKQRFEEQMQQSEQKNYSEDLKEKQQELNKQLNNLLNEELKKQMEKLQELMQKRFRTPPQYELMSTAGPEHDKTFAVKVRMGEQVLGSGRGKSKKEAEQDAARDAVTRMQEGR